MSEASMYELLKTYNNKIKRYTIKLVIILPANRKFALFDKEIYKDSLDLHINGLLSFFYKYRLLERANKVYGIIFYDEFEHERTLTVTGEF